MRAYLKSFSAFRALLVLLLLLSLGLYARRERRNDGELAPGDAVSTRTVDVFLQCVDDFGGCLSVIESAGIALAARIESRPRPFVEADVEAALRDCLDTSPADLEAVAVSFFRTPGASGSLAFLRRDGRVDGAQFVTGLTGTGIFSRAPSPREINFDRRMVWTFSPGTDDETRGHGLVFATALKNGSGDEGVFLRAEASWLVDILRRLRDRGRAFPVCAAPDRTLVWLDGDEVRTGGGGSGEGSEANRFLLRAAGDLAVSHDRDSDRRFIRAEILGTGWELLATNPETKAAPTPFSFWLVCLSVAALVVDAVISVRFVRARRGAGERSPPPQARRDAPGEGGLLYNFLFKYRMINPVQARIDSELRVARSIQFSLVPDSFPLYSAWREFDIHSLLDPAREVGGDFYDFLMPDPNRLAFAVGDVSGKGVPAALYMAVCRTALRALVRQAGDPSQLVGQLNELLVRDNQSGLYVTLACFFIDLPTGRADYVLAGHPAPLWKSGADGRVDFIDQPRETVAGVRSGLVFPMGTLQLRRGDTILLYSDGVTEARSGSGDELDYSGLRECFNRADSGESCRELVDAMREQLRVFTGEGPQGDDITLLAFRYWGPGGRKATGAVETRQRETATPRGDAVKE